MKHDRRLPSFTEEQFHRQLAEIVRELSLPPADRDPAGASSDRSAPQQLYRRLYRHYVELRRWNPRISLVGPGTTGDVLRRHYGESLAALALLEPGDRALVDVGSGGGFPGLVLAAARPAFDVILLEPRERKWLFLKTAARRSGLSCRCLQERVGRSLPAGLPEKVDLVTCRALTLTPEIFGLFQRRSPGVRFLIWFGEGEPELPESLEIRRVVPLAGSRRRRILEIRPETPDPQIV